jgi:uncharacterized protein (TIGR00303 family)
MNNSMLKTLHDPASQSDKLTTLLKERKVQFLLALGSTKTSDIPNVSAAGASSEMRRLTPSIDADLLLTGRLRQGDSFPVSPLGIVSPVVITKACLELLQVEPIIVDCGTFRRPTRCNLTAGTIVANSVSSGQALPEGQVFDLFKQGLAFAKSFKESFVRGECFIIGECVPGGTTTALAVLKGLGVAADGLVSSSLPAVNVEQKKLVDTGLAKLAGEIDPFAILAAVGDPMQPFVAGFVTEASQHTAVILAGGSQMLAVYHLCRRLKPLYAHGFAAENTVVVTTKWVVEDRYSNAAQLSIIIDAPFFAAYPDFTTSRFGGLKAYEDGHVKEGLGAGALMAAAAMKLSLSNEALMEAIDTVYQNVVLDRGRNLIPS